MKLNFFRVHQKVELVRGFTLIELLVTIAIIGVLTSIVLVNLSSMKNLKDVESAAMIMGAKLSEAQTSALTGRQYTENTIPCSYRVSWYNSEITNAYVYKDGSGNCSQVLSISTSSLPNQVLFSGSGSADFSLPHGRTASAQVVTVQKSGISRVICVTSNGRIEVKTSASSC